MFKNLIFPICLFTLVSTSFAYTCKKNLIKQADMNECSYNQYLDSDKTLNEVYAKILVKYKNYPAALHNSIVAERLWVKFLNAQLEMKFPPLKNGAIYGSIQPIYKYDYLKDLTDERTKQLKEILTDNYVDELNE
jgi:uncharacterized protein YecT (DUF1311 family)